MSTSVVADELNVAENSVFIAICKFSFQDLAGAAEKKFKSISPQNYVNSLFCEALRTTRAFLTGH